MSQFPLKFCWLEGFEVWVEGGFFLVLGSHGCLQDHISCGLRVWSASLCLPLPCLAPRPKAGGFLTDPLSARIAAAGGIGQPSCYLLLRVGLDLVSLLHPGGHENPVQGFPCSTWSRARAAVAPSRGSGSPICLSFGTGSSGLPASLSMRFKTSPWCHAWHPSIFVAADLSCGPCAAVADQTSLPPEEAHRLTQGFL